MIVPNVGIQAWSVAADLVVNTRDAAAFGGLLVNTMAERARLYQAYNDARRPFEESTS